MPLLLQSIKNGEEYKDLVEKFLYLVDSEFEKCESLKNSDISGLATSMPKLISLVNTIGYLRGQDNAFVDVRPSIDFQDELYRNEDLFEKRLYALIEFINSSEARDKYKFCVKEYFLKARKAE